MNKIKGVIFDMDGVLVNSEVHMRECAKAALSEFGVHAQDKDFEPFIGAGEDKFVGGVAELHGVPYHTRMKDRAYELYIEKASEGVHVFPRIPELFRRLENAGIRVAVASSADRIKVDTNLQAIGIQPKILSGLVTGDEVDLKKPAPDIFLEAARRMDLPPESCIVVEDAINGIHAASAAGMRSIGITGTFTSEQLKSAGAVHVEDDTCAIGEWVCSITEDR